MLRNLFSSIGCVSADEATAPLQELDAHLDIVHARI